MTLPCHCWFDRNETQDGSQTVQHTVPISSILSNSFSLLSVFGLARQLESNIFTWSAGPFNGKRGVDQRETCDTWLDRVGCKRCDFCQETCKATFAQVDGFCFLQAVKIPLASGSEVTRACTHSGQMDCDQVGPVIFKAGWVPCLMSGIYQLWQAGQPSLPFSNRISIIGQIPETQDCREYKKGNDQNALTNCLPHFNAATLCLFELRTKILGIEGNKYWRDRLLFGLPVVP